MIQMTRSLEVGRHSRSFEVALEEEPPLPPSRRLLTAILLRAVRDFVTYRNAKEGTEQYAIMIDAAGWLWWEGEEALTFRDICDQIDADPEKIRRVALTLKPSELLRMVPPSED